MPAHRRHLLQELVLSCQCTHRLPRQPAHTGSEVLSFSPAELQCEGLCQLQSCLKVCKRFLQAVTSTSVPQEQLPNLHSAQPSLSLGYLAGDPSRHSLHTEISYTQAAARAKARKLTSQGNLPGSQALSELCLWSTFNAPKQSKQKSKTRDMKRRREK